MSQYKKQSFLIFKNFQFVNIYYKWLRLLRKLLTNKQWKYIYMKSLYRSPRLCEIKYKIQLKYIIVWILYLRLYINLNLSSSKFNYVQIFLYH